MGKKTVLIAVREQDVPLVSQITQSEFQVEWCHTLNVAKGAFSAQIGLIACGVHFDEGAMFELLRAAKADPIVRDLPFWLVLRHDTPYSRPVIASIRSAAFLMEADKFIDLAELINESGQKQAFEKLRQMARAVLNMPLMYSDTEEGSGEVSQAAESHNE